MKLVPPRVTVLKPSVLSVPAKASLSMSLLLARITIAESAANRKLSPFTEYLAATQDKAKARKTCSTRAVASPRLFRG